MQKLFSWNVNGLRAILGKGFLDFIDREKPDVLCLQEIKLSMGQLDLELEGYEIYYNFAEKKGYSGTAILTRIKPINVTYGIGIPEHDHEGRVITMEFKGCYLVNVYTPNAQRGLERLPYRMSWEDEFRNYLISLNRIKPVIVCGDMNVAHEEIDLKNPKANRQNAGFSDEERGKFSELLNSGFVDSFRFFYPDKTDAYTWWSYMFKAREKNVGWRIDYFCVSKELQNQIIDAVIHSDVLGSDHCPVELKMNDDCFV